MREGVGKAAMGKKRRLGVVAEGTVIALFSPLDLSRRIEVMFELSSSSKASSTNLLLRRRAERAEKQLQAVIKISRTLALTHDKKRLLTLIMDTVTDLMEADRSTLFLIDHENREIVSQFIQKEQNHQLRLPIGQGVAGWVAQTGETVNLIDAYKDPRFHVKVDQESGYTTRSLLTMPLRTLQGHNIAVIQVLNKKNGQAFTDEDEHLLEAISAQATIFLENAGLYSTLVQKNRELLSTSQTLQQRNFELDILFAIEQQMSGAFDLEEMLDNILRRVLELLDCEAGFVGLVEKNKQIRVYTITQRPLDHTMPEQLPQHEGFLGWCSRYGQKLLAHTPPQDQRYQQDISRLLGFPIRNLLCLPLLDGEGAIGAIELVNKGNEGESFQDSDLRILSLVAARISRAIIIGRERSKRMRQNRLATIGKLLSGILHDFKTPMTLISGYAQLTVLQEDAEKRKTFADMIQKQIDRLNHMAREVLAFARGESTLLVRKVHLNQFIQEITQQLEQEFSNSPVKLIIRPDYMGEAYFDESKIERVIHNLARNALQAMPQGGVFTLSLQQEGDQLAITAQDTGIGIPKELQSQIFDSFVTSRPNQGTGLGLAIVKKIIKDHQGQISFTSEPQKGTTFRVLLPLQGPAATTSLPSPAAAA